MREHERNGVEAHSRPLGVPASARGQRRSLKIGVLAVLVVLVLVLALAWALFTELTYVSLSATHGKPAASVGEIGRRLGPYLTRSHALSRTFADTGPGEEDDQKYRPCMRWFSQDDTFPQWMTAPKDIPIFRNDVRTRDGLRPVWVRAWVLPDPSAGQQAIARARGYAQACGGEHRSGIQTGEADIYRIEVTEYERRGWTGIDITTDGVIGDEDYVAVEDPNTLMADTYRYGTVLVTHGQLLVELKWGGEPPWYQRTSAWDRRGDASVSAILQVLGG